VNTLTWLDTSEKDRCRTLEFIDTFGERDTRDELGIGVVRDAFFDLMFPGTSTVQTRATYFLLVPWWYLKAKGVRAAHLRCPRHARHLPLGAARSASSSPWKPGGGRGGPTWPRRQAGPHAAAQRHLQVGVGDLGHPALRRFACWSSIAIWSELRGEGRWPSSPIPTRNRSGASASPPTGTRIFPPPRATCERDRRFGSRTRRPTTCGRASSPPCPTRCRPGWLASASPLFHGMRRID